MNTRCKPGDLAIIIADVPQCSGNIGRAVAVSGPLATDPNGRLTWLIRPVTPEPYLIHSLADSSVRFMDWQERNIEHPDEWMMPVTPDDQCRKNEESKRLRLKQPINV